MAVGVVQALEVIQVQHGDAQRRAAAVGAGRLALEHVVQATAVQAACQLVFPHQFAHMLELRF
ncbi:hypothetical protein D3C79_1098430 [compost metagenome]